MKSIKTLRFTKGIIAIAIAAGGFSTSGFAIEANILGTPDDGMVCRTGYGAFFSAGNIKCSKSQSINVVLDCLDPGFPTYVNRANAPGPHTDADVCTKDPNAPGYIAVTVNSSLAGLIESINGSPGVYALARVNPATVATRISNLDQSEAAALGLSASSVDTVSGLTTVNRNFTLGVKDNATVLVTHYTFAVPSFGGIIVGPATPASTFVPRPLQ